MISQLSITFGSKDVLEQVQAKNPDRPMLLLETTTSGEQLALLDVSGQESVFASPVHYDIKLHRGTTDWGRFVNFMYFDNLSPDDQKVFNSKANHFVTTDEMPEGLHAIYFMKEEHNRSNNIILTVWDTSEDFAVWKRDERFKPFVYFQRPLNNYHEASYQSVEQDN
ncbi:hypothetical protein AYR62_04280 [Secundilactobacillus paracollinoides]|uniref:Monooxygenase n=1 Tax=Secundilactobacillus paracollinoides TaxID=240427 RepID=A0A1B2J041_9LACO|nr:hypothetical protein [Secundilactobacillus paracollinoides]ANZ61738.1 hypothetical protein AYR61_10565 [Secundilactobacillus paracollinoides]ANZ63374.1 hypothetical protein AYR62_04280 [Secundilactobacillus paracollinoides]ANZ67657.1 hypothetical protein AYR63_11320 [Secundilactobacillus paracollinoides]KRL79627.1 monooxygenase [Secundilactobacillus paracollinoides DSM 15502 = JCM 11969]